MTNFFDYFIHKSKNKLILRKHQPDVTENANYNKIIITELVLQSTRHTVTDTRALRALVCNCMSSCIAKPSSVIIIGTNTGEPFENTVKKLRDLPVMKQELSQGTFWAHFLFSSKIKTTYPGVHAPISSLALRPKLGLWWS